jgi:hypothetical protein
MKVTVSEWTYRVRHVGQRNSMKRSSILKLIYLIYRVRPSVRTDVLYIISHNFLNTFSTTRAATHFLKHAVQKPVLNTVINCILPTYLPCLAAWFCTENVVENFSHAHQLEQLLAGLSRSLKKQKCSCVCVCLCACVYVWQMSKEHKRTVARNY